MKLHRKGGLSVFWRIYLYGFLLLLLVAMAAGVATHMANAFGQGPKVHSTHRTIALLFTSYVEQNPQGSAELDALLQRLYEMTNISISVYDVDNQRIGHAGNLVSTPLEPHRINRLKHKHFVVRDSRPNTIIPLGTRDEPLGYTICTWQHGGFIRFGVVIVVVLMLLALLPWLLARTITVPLRKIAGTAREIGEGNLAARTGVDRHDEAGVLARDVDRMAAQIQGLIRSEKALMANISHEIRTPLARIRVLLELIEESDGASPQEHLDGLKTDVQELESLLEDVFLTARLDLIISDREHSGLVVKPESIEVESLIDTISSLFKRQHPQVELVFRQDPRVKTVQADPRLLKRLLLNLLDNAVKYAGESSPVELEITSVNDGICFAILDRGPGIAEIDIDQIFEPFFRAQRQSGSGKPGVGIGLTLCHRIALAHGGHIRAANRPGGGAVLELVLPSPVVNKERC